MSDYPQGIPFETKFGTLHLGATSADHIFLTSCGRHKIVVNTVESVLMVHFGLYNGSWQLQRDRHGAYNYHSLILRKEETGDDCSEAARTKVIHTLTVLVNEWAKKNPDVLRKAALYDLDCQITSLENEKEKIETRLQEVISEIDDLNRKRQALEKT